MTTATRDDLHAMIDQLSDNDLRAVSLFVEFVRARGGHAAGVPASRVAARRSEDDSPTWIDVAHDDPVATALATAPEDDEPTTEEENAAAESHWQAYRRGEYAAHEDVRREIGW
jgi:hypothetical protein